MGLKIKKIVKYKTPDQKEWENEQNAIEHCKNQYLQNILIQHFERNIIVQELKKLTPDQIVREFSNIIARDKEIISKFFNQTENIKVI